MTPSTNCKPVTLIPFEHYLADAECPELFEAFNGPEREYDYDEEVEYSYTE